MNLLKVFRRGVEALRQPDRQPRCYDLTEAERLQQIILQNRNVWNSHQLTKLDQA